MAVAFSYSACFTNDEAVVVVLRPPMADECPENNERAALLEADFARLAQHKSVALDFQEVRELTAKALRVLRMFRRMVAVHGGSLALCNVCASLRPSLGKGFYVKEGS